MATKIKLKDCSSPEDFLQYTTEGGKLPLTERTAVLAMPEYSNYKSNLILDKALASLNAVKA